MNIAIMILLILGGLIVLILVAGIFMRRHHFVRREIVINASSRKIFDFIRLLENQDRFNKHAMTGGDRERKYTGTDGTVGFIYAWKGNKNAGEGEKEIRKIVDGKMVEMEIRFVKPMKTSATITMELEQVSDNQTRVLWSNAGTLGYPVNIMIPIMEKMLPKDMDASLVNLKNILES